MTAREGPANGWARHDCGYAPLLTGDRLVKKNDPAYQMAELTRDPGCLTELVRVRAVKIYHLGYFHSHRSQREYSGYPDVHVWAARPGAEAFRELKRMDEAPTPAQVATLTALHTAGNDVGVWWPCCWYSGRIDRELAALAGVPPVGQHWAPGLPPQPGQAGYRPWLPDVPPDRPGLRRGAAMRAELAAGQPAGERSLDQLPGHDLPADWPPGQAAAIVIPAPDGTRGAAYDQFDAWLRAAGVRPTVVPYPARIVVTAADGAAVQCRPLTGGAPVWRHIRPGDVEPWPGDLAEALGADAIIDPRHVLDFATDLPHSSTIR